MMFERVFVYEVYYIYFQTLERLFALNMKRVILNWIVQMFYLLLLFGLIMSININ